MERWTPLALSHSSNIVYLQIHEIPFCILTSFLCSPTANRHAHACAGPGAAVVFLHPSLPAARLQAEPAAPLHVPHVRTSSLWLTLNSLSAGRKCSVCVIEGCCSCERYAVLENYT